MIRSKDDLIDWQGVVLKLNECVKQTAKHKAKSDKIFEEIELLERFVECD